jgi:Xaa-Pro dipeptidase
MDHERIASIRNELSRNDIDAIVCGLPKHVLLLSGYWPVVGTSVAVASSDGSIHLVVPEDEKELAARAQANLHTYNPGSLDRLTSAAEAVREPLNALRPALEHARIAVESGQTSEPASYSSMHLFGEALPEALKGMFPQATFVPGSALLERLGAVKTAAEIDRIRVACAIARFGFEGGSGLLRPGLPEIMAAQLFRDRIKRYRIDCPDVQREEDFIWVMSGVNSAKAHGAYARSRTKVIEAGDLILVHCNSAIDGYWTDITRTYSLGKPDDGRLRMYEAIFAAREKAFEAIAPGRPAADIDHAARSVLKQYNYGKEFKHSTGHGVGFEAISANALPRLHPKSPDILRAGMVFNVEPAIYIEGYGGIRHCDMVVVTEGGYQLLTPFQASPEEVVL